MPSLNFMECFAGMVERGEKTQTIRRSRKRPIKAGDTLSLYTGQRSKVCLKLGVGRCVRVREIRIDEGCVALDSVILDGFWPVMNIVKADGFDLPVDFLAFFRDRYGLPFEGVLIEWELEPKSDG